MDKILIHIAGIAFLEIVFYFTYIGPMETKLFKETFKGSLNSIYKDDTNPNTINFNITNIVYEYENNNYQDKLKNDYNLGMKDRIKYNNDLFIKMVSYWFIFFMGTLLVYIIHIIYRNKYSNHAELPAEIPFHNIEDNNFEDNTSLLINNKKKKYKIIYKIIYYTVFGGLILLFEYIFFQYIVTQYHVISQYEIKYIIYSQLISNVNNHL